MKALKHRGLRGVAGEAGCSGDRDAGPGRQSGGEKTVPIRWVDKPSVRLLQRMFALQVRIIRARPRAPRADLTLLGLSNRWQFSS